MWRFHLEARAGLGLGSSAPAVGIARPGNCTSKVVPLPWSRSRMRILPPSRLTSVRTMYRPKPGARLFAFQFRAQADEAAEQLAARILGNAAAVVADCGRALWPSPSRRATLPPADSRRWRISRRCRSGCGRSAPDRPARRGPCTASDPASRRLRRHADAAGRRSRRTLRIRPARSNVLRLRHRLAVFLQAGGIEQVIDQLYRAARHLPACNLKKSSCSSGLTWRRLSVCR